MTVSSYSAQSIRQLEGLEAIRRLPGMYIGDNQLHGLHHLLYEIISNSVDEILNGHGTSVLVELHEDGSASVADDARGIPVEWKPESNMSALTQVLTLLHAGGKFREAHDQTQDAYYAGSGGLHGIGAKATNAFSVWLEATVRRYGVTFRQRFEQGGTPTDLVQIVEAGDKVIGEINADTQLEIKKDLLTHLTVKKKKTAVKADAALGTGTTIRFRPYRPWFDEEMEWPDLDSTPWDFNRLAVRLEQIAHLHPGVRITLRDWRGELQKHHKERIFYSKDGLLDYIKALNEGATVVNKAPIHFKGQNDDGSITVEAVLQYTTGEETQIYSFVNSISTPLGGTAVSGMQAGLTKAINQWASEKKLAKGTQIRGDDTLLGLTAILNVTMTKTPQFSSQTKEALTTSEAQGVAMSITYDHLLAHFKKNTAIGKLIVSQAEAAAKGRSAAQAARKLVIRKSVLDAPDSGTLGKLADVARATPKEQTTLFIVEGDSAGGSCKQARDRRYHAILPMRGKILNTEKATLNKILASSEIKSIVAAIGAGIGADCDLEAMRYGRVAIMVDADVDGAHIRTLLLTLFWRHMKPMVQAGRLFIAQAPLYQLRHGRGDVVYAYDDIERRATLHLWGDKDKITIQRYKGLGEMNPAQLRETVFSPEAQAHMKMVTAEDIRHTNHTIGTLMGSQVGPRKTWLFETWAGETEGAQMAGETDTTQDEADE